MKNSILIVDDDIIIAELIEDKICSLGFNVAGIATNYYEALELINTLKPSVILIDIHLDDEKNGIDLAIAIDKEFNIPYIFLTSDNSTDTILKTAKTKQIAFLNKEFSSKTLKANLLIALDKNQQNKFIELNNGYFYDKTEQIIYYKNKPIYLSPNEKIFLTDLVEHKNHILLYKTIENSIWGGNPPTASSSIRELVRALRKKLTHLEIITVRGIGYKLP